MKIVASFACLMILAGTASAQPDMSKLQKTWESWNRTANQEANSVKLRVQKTARKLANGWDALSKSEQVVIAKEVWALRKHIDLISWLGSDEASKFFGGDVRAVRVLMDGLKVARGIVAAESPRTRV